MKPRWLELAEKEIGIKEVHGEAYNPRIIDYWRLSKAGSFSDDETPWCAAFVGAMLEQSGIAGTRRANAKSYITWGQTLETPCTGAVAILNRLGGAAWQGHVGFLVRQTETTVTLLGGNQADRVCLADFSKERLSGFKWPGHMTVDGDPVPYGKADSGTVSDR